MGSYKMKSDKMSPFVAFLSLFLGGDKSYRGNFEKRQIVAFLSLFCSFFVFFWNFLCFLDLKIFLFGRNSLTFVLMRPFLPDVTLLTWLFSKFMLFLKCRYLISTFYYYFFILKQLQIGDKKSYKKATKRRQTPTKK